MTAGYKALRESAAWLDLAARGRIRVTGEDRARLLHAMSTNDINGLKPGQGLYTFFLNDKGRILTDCYVYCFVESFLLDTEPETAQLLYDHLDKYIIADDVTLEFEGAFSCAAIEGPRALEQGFPVADQAFATQTIPGGFTARVSVTGEPAVRLFLPKAEWLSSLPEATADDIRIVRLENGQPRFGEDIGERYLVQETQQMHAVHANKGCYLGQEIVERVRSRGQVHRFLTAIRMTTHAAPAPGTKLEINGNPAAEITSAAYSPALGETVALAYVRQDALNTQTPEWRVQSSPSKRP